MRNVLAALILALVPLPVAADPQAVRRTIDDQIAAFQADDFAAAFGYASPSIQGLLRDPANFGRMVRNGYPMVWRPAEVEHLGGEVVGSGWQQEVLITDGGGRLHVLRYAMVETPDGWRINGVEILATPDAGA